MTDIFSTPPFNTEYVKQHTANDLPSPLATHRTLHYFHHALGAIDGSHIPIKAPAQYRDACRNRKGFISQNCLFVCSFNFFFTYGLTGWEGSASDARVYHEAVEAVEDPLVIPPTSYLLADGGYPHCRELLTPYRNTRYHLAEWGRVNLRQAIFILLRVCFINFNSYIFSPNKKEELFNLRHAQARNVIEHIFGALKRRFRILSIGCEYSMDVQPKIPSALCAVHNFIHIHDPQVEARNDEDDDHDLHGNAGDHGVHGVGYVVVDDVEGDDVAARRNTIARAMWDDYLVARGMAGYNAAAFFDE
jgi:DDE superfamily endonuclease